MSRALRIPQGRRHDVLCVGTALIDHLSEVSFEQVRALGLSIGTMTLIDGPRRHALAAAAGAGTTVSGGTVANTAVGIASLGGRPVYLGAVARDALGERYEEDLLDAGVHAVLQRFAPGGEDGTGVCYVLITPDAERTMATHLGVSGRLESSMISDGLVGAAALVYFDGYLLDFPEARAIVSELLSAARATGTAVAVGLADRLVVERHAEELTSLVQHADVVLCNEAEAMALAKTEDHLEALEQLASVTALAVMTRGGDGALLATAGRVLAVPAEPVAEIRDLTGAGDLFAAGVCFGLTHGDSVEVAGRLGALCAAEAIAHVGARPNLSLASLAERAGLVLTR